MPDKGSDQKVAPKMVRESDLLAVKSQLKGFKDQLSSKDAEIVRLTSELKAAKVNLEDDDEVKDVRKWLIDRAAELDERQSEQEKIKQDIEEREASFKGKERGSLVQTLASKYGIEIDAIKDADDPEKEALRLVVEREAGEIKTPAEKTFETTPAGGRVKKDVWKMKPDEFQEYEQELKEKAGIK